MWHQWTTMKKLIWLRFLNAASAVIKTVTGKSPLVLENAIARAITSLTQYGKTTQASTPTPDAPVDIYCNNGALKMVDDELPSAYKRVLGFSCDNNAMWAITGFKLKGSDTVRVSFSVNAACNVFGCYQGADATDNYDLYVSTTAGSKYFRYGSGTYLSYFSNANLGQRFDVVFTPTGSQGMPQDSTWTEATFTSANDLLIGATTLTGSSAKIKGNLYGNIVVDGRLKLIPGERVSDGVLGYYDTYSETFFEPYAGFDGAVSLGYDGSHYSMEVVGTPEVLMVSGVNLCNPDFYQGDGWYVGGNDTVANANANGTLVFPCKPNTTYSWWHTAGAGGCRAFELPTETVTQGQAASWAVGNPAYTDANVVKKCTTSASAKLLCVCFGREATNVGRTLAEQLADFMLVEGDITTATAYEPYVAPQTVNDVPMLLSVGDYKDTQEIISGLLTHKVGVKVLDGTEGWLQNTTYKRFTTQVPDMVSAPSRSLPFLSTHFVTTYSATTEAGYIYNAANNTTVMITHDAADVTAFKAWLAAQYAAGTPVIVLYPLAEETTETVAGQALNTTDGTNIITVTAEVSDIDLRVEYSGAA